MKRSQGTSMGSALFLVGGPQALEVASTRPRQRSIQTLGINDGSPRLQSSASAKEEGDEASAGTAIDQEAKMVNAEVRKKSRG